MEKWLDLLTPSAAALALLLVIAVVVQAIRHGRAVRRLESRLAEREGAGARVSLDRLRSLQARSGISEGIDIPRPGLRGLGIALSTLVVLGGMGVGAWYLFIREDGATAVAPTTTTPTTSTSPKPKPKPVGEDPNVPANPDPLPLSPGAYTVLVLNGTNIAGAAARTVPLVQAGGYGTVEPDNATEKVKVSYVMYLPDKQVVADNVAKELGIKKHAPLDGYPEDRIGDVDAIVVVGEDLAKRNAP